VPSLLFEPSDSDAWLDLNQRLTGSRVEAELVQRDETSGGITLDETLTPEQSEDHKEH